MPSIRKRLGPNARRFRTKKGWSQEDYADRAGIHRTYVSDVERGARNHTITVVEKLARKRSLPERIIIFHDHPGNCTKLIGEID